MSSQATWQRWQMYQRGAVKPVDFYVIRLILAIVFFWLSHMPPFPPFLSPPFVLMLAGTSNSPLTACSSHALHTHTQRLTGSYSCTLPVRGTSQHNRSPSSVCQRLTQNTLRAAIVWVYQQRGSKLSPPPTNWASPLEHDNTWWETTTTTQGQIRKEALRLIRKLHLWGFDVKYLDFYFKVNWASLFTFFLLWLLWHLSPPSKHRSGPWKCVWDCCTATLCSAIVMKGSEIGPDLCCRRLCGRVNLRFMPAVSLSHMHKLVCICAKGFCS